jgi:hypothetical protein
MILGFLDEVVRDLKRVHRSRRAGRTARHLRPRSTSVRERTRRLRWVFGTVVLLVAAVAVAVLMPA